METEWHEDRVEDPAGHRAPHHRPRRSTACGRTAAPRQVPHPPGEGHRARHHRDLREQPRRWRRCTPTSSRTRTVWQPRPADRELEAEMLARILVKLGTATRASPPRRRTPRRAAAPPASAAGSAAARANAVLRECRRRPAGGERRLRPRLAPRRPRARPRRLHGRGPRPLQGPLLRALHRSRGRPARRARRRRASSTS